MARDLALYDDATIDATITKAPAVKGPSVWTRMLEAFASSRRRQAESAVERYIAMNGGRLTDNMERDISRKFGRMAGDGL